ncbi:MAG: LytTR family DNA-binding domain-containing protein [Clostridia bacterium]|nr:LytTR family DNA-binding domain-containing protein [Clostridia bacterium]
MKINIEKEKNNELEKNEFNIKILFSGEIENVDKFASYISKYENYEDKIMVSDNNNLVSIYYKDIICFFSDKKYNYCRTKDKKYRIKSKLYEIERANSDFIRISKSCIINIDKVKSFNIGQTGKVVVRFIDDTEEIVARRKIKDLMVYLDERRV